MNRRELLTGSTALGLMTALPSTRRWFALGRKAEGDSVTPLRPPAKGGIPVAFLVSDGAVIIDFCGPWEVFQDVNVPGDGGFRLFTVAEKKDAIQASGGMKIVPDYTFETAPQPKIIVIPAQGGNGEKTVEWIRKASRGADVTMSVCTGAFLLASTGLLAGKAATTHHSGYRGLAVNFPDITVKRGARFVDNGSVATAGGLSSGIDLALHIVERYYGREVAEKTAYQMEYQGKGWTDPNSNEVYAAATTVKFSCPVCEMEVDPSMAPQYTYKGTTYYFCALDHKELFAKAPEKYTKALAEQGAH
jgi:putative intracellular protease/amidase